MRIHLSSQEYDAMKCGWDIVKNAYSGDRQDVLAFQIDGKIYDLASHLPAWPQEDSTLSLVTRDSPEGIHILRHSAAHVLAQAVKELYPLVQVTIGPVIDNGFYYDFQRDEPFRPDDLVAIEARMHEIVKRNLTVIRHEWSRSEAIAFFEKRGERFKVKIIQEIPEDQILSVYQQDDFYDLCRGPHLPSTRYLDQGFCLTKMSAAYWKGESKNVSLQRIYGTAWPSKAALTQYLTCLEEAEKRDHRKLGQQMDLFHFQEEAPGSIFWHPAGWSIYQTLRHYMRNRLRQDGYCEVNTPQMVSKSLWEASGHWQKFRENMYAIESEEQIFALKPMNCPCHIQIFNHSPKSYRDLPLRMAEFGCCMRHEASGARAGLMRVTSFVQDDAHIFCTPEQMVDETTSFCKLLFSVYKDLGFDDVIVRFSTRPDVRLGDETMWDQAEESLKKGADASGLNYTLFPGEGAFYGPKLEFALKDSLGRLWQCGTLQVDFVLPQRLKAYFTGSDGNKHHPVMLHRAILGSFERFMGVLLEHTGGNLPTWLAPIQAVIVPITEKVRDYAQTIHDMLWPLRVEIDGRNEKLGFKIREHTLKKVPFMIVVGEKEKENQTVMIRIKGEQISLEKESLSHWLTAQCKVPSMR